MARLALCIPFALAFLAGCGAGLSEEEAQQRCDQLRETNAAGCLTAAAYEECRIAHEDCGDDVLITESCPQQFSCPE